MKLTNKYLEAKGFERDELDGYHWYSLKDAEFEFLTNDSISPNNWFMGFRERGTFGDDFIFLKHCKNELRFESLYYELTNKRA